MKRIKIIGRFKPCIYVKKKKICKLEIGFKNALRGFFKCIIYFERQRERKRIPSRLRAISSEPNVGCDP